MTSPPSLVLPAAQGQHAQDHSKHLAGHHPLYSRLWAHPFESDHHSTDLTRRLALEMGWTPAHARAAIEEYRRFCFLAVVAEHAVTPSVEVDAVWHLHLLHTRDYWEVFCPQVLGRSLHHGPSQGGSDQQALFYAQYAQTLRSYQHWFGSPPVAFWPSSSLRFQPANRWRWVFLPDAWVVPKPQILKRFRILPTRFHQITKRIFS